MGGIPRRIYESIGTHMKILGFTTLLASHLVMTWIIIKAFISGNWNIMFRFNEYGEGPFELGLYLISVPCVILYLRDKRG